MAKYQPAKTKNEPGAYMKLREELKAGRHSPLYAFFGEERYALEWALGTLRKMVAPGTEEFNDRRLEGKTMTVNDLTDALELVPMFSDFVFVEVWDYDLAKTDEETRRSLVSLLSDIPEYMSVVFIYDTAEFRVDARVKGGKELKDLFNAVEFTRQPDSDLVKWIRKHFSAVGKSISQENAEYLIFLTGGLMTGMNGEIEKVSAYSTGDEVTRSDIDTVVEPQLEAKSWDLTDALISGDNNAAAEKLTALLSMNEAPHLILGAISKRFRQQLAARALADERITAPELARLLGIKEYPAKLLLSGAKKMSLERCKRMVELTAETAYKLNSARFQSDRDLMCELIVNLATA